MKYQFIQNPKCNYKENYPKHNILSYYSRTRFPVKNSLTKAEWKFIEKSFGDTVYFTLPLSRTNETDEGNEIVPFFILQNGHQEFGTEGQGFGG